MLKPKQRVERTVGEAIIAIQKLKTLPYTANQRELDKIRDAVIMELSDALDVLGAEVDETFKL